MQAVIYARYSSDKQNEESIDAQVRACKEYAAHKGYTVLDIYADEAVSGKNSRPPPISKDAEGCRQGKV